jgi:type IV pilus assembly protein PilB
LVALDSRDDNKIGQILMDEGIITAGQLQDALTEQEHQAMYKPLGEILRELGFITRRQLRNALLRYQKQIPLGDLLVKMGLISHIQLGHALAMQKAENKKLGRILVERGFIEWNSVLDGICLQHGIQGMHLAPIADNDLLKNVNISFLQTRRVLPLSYDRDRKVLLVLMEDPADTETISDLEKVFKMEVEPIMLRTGASARLFEGLLDVWYLSR